MVIEIPERTSNKKAKEDFKEETSYVLKGKRRNNGARTHLAPNHEYL